MKHKIVGINNEDNKASDCLLLLLQEGADPNTIDEYGNTPVRYADIYENNEA